VAVPVALAVRGGCSFFFLFSLALLQYQEHEKRAEPNFISNEAYYIGTLVDIPEAKPRSIACHVKTDYPVNKKVIPLLAAV